MRLFKNKYKTRIEAKVKELETEWWKVTDLKKEIDLKMKRKTSERMKQVHYAIMQDRLQEQIKLLKDLLI